MFLKLILVQIAKRPTKTRWGNFFEVYTDDMNNTSPINTILLVIVLVILVGGGVWWYQTYGPGAPKTGGIQINLGGSSNQ